MNTNILRAVVVSTDYLCNINVIIIMTVEYCVGLQILVPFLC
jgi:hypothetical protein